MLSCRRRHTRDWRDWSSDVFSSDLCRGHGDQTDAVLEHGVPEAQVQDRQLLARIGPDPEDGPARAAELADRGSGRSGEGRVGKRWKTRWSPYPLKKTVLLRITPQSS